MDSPSLDVFTLALDAFLKGLLYPNRIYELTKHKVSVSFNG